MQHRDKTAILKMIDEMGIGLELLGDTPLEAFLAGEMLKRALGMTAINVGELVKLVSDDLRTAYPDFPWRAVAGMRDIPRTGIRRCGWKMSLLLSMMNIPCCWKS